jgi:hypothetical protein
VQDENAAGRDRHLKPIRPRGGRPAPLYGSELSQNS